MQNRYWSGHDSEESDKDVGSLRIRGQEVAPCHSLKALKQDGWNRVTMEAKGNTMKTWVNGITAAHWVSDEFTQGLLGINLHAGPSATILFRTIKVKELTPN